MHGADMPGRSEYQAHGVLGHRRVAVAGNGRDLDAELLGRREVDEAGGAGAEEDDVLQARTVSQRLLVEVARIVDDGIVALDQPGNVGRGRRSHVDRDRDVGRAMHPLPDEIDLGRRIDEQGLGHGAHRTCSATRPSRSRVRTTIFWSRPGHCTRNNMWSVPVSSP